MLCKTKRSACCGNVLNCQKVCDTNQSVLMLNTLQRPALFSLHAYRDLQFHSLLGITLTPQQHSAKSSCLLYPVSVTCSLSVLYQAVLNYLLSQYPPCDKNINLFCIWRTIMSEQRAAWVGTRLARKRNWLLWFQGTSMLYKQDSVLSQEERGSNISEEVNPTASSIFPIFLPWLLETWGQILKRDLTLLRVRVQAWYGTIWHTVSYWEQLTGACKSQVAVSAMGGEDRLGLGKKKPLSCQDKWDGKNFGGWQRWPVSAHSLGSSGNDWLQHRTCKSWAGETCRASETTEGRWGGCRMERWKWMSQHLWWEQLQQKELMTEKQRGLLGPGCLSQWVSRL